jgi:hypothetical protein
MVHLPAKIILIKNNYSVSSVLMKDHPPVFLQLLFTAANKPF